MEGFTTAEMKRFNYLIGETNAAYHDAAWKLGLSDSVMQILYAICNSGDNCMLGNICRLSGISKQTVNSALRKMEADGIIYLEKANGKAKRVYLTDSGKILAENTVVRLIEIENEILASWTKEELEQFLELNRKYLISFEEKIREL